MTNENHIEQEIQSKGLNAPRLKPSDIDDIIVGVAYFTAADGFVGALTATDEFNALPEHERVVQAPSQLETMTFCILILRNGFTVTGESACASPENFDPEIGQKIAYENARNKIWMLEGYLLKQKLSEQ